MNDKQQIEEMKNCVTCMHYYYCHKNMKAFQNGEVARAKLYKEVEEQGCIYYTHEGSVVLTRAAWYEQQNFKYELGFKTGKQIARKETAREIIKSIKQKYGKSCSEYYPFLLVECLSSELDELTKEQFGVEVEE